MRSKKHVPKSLQDRQQLAKTVKLANYEPTIDESPSFHESNKIPESDADQQINEPNIKVRYPGWQKKL